MAQPRMFADNTSVSYASDSLDEIQNVINSELKNLNSWLIAISIHSVMDYYKSWILIGFSTMDYS